jgi:hypothetical protein
MLTLFHWPRPPFEGHLSAARHRQAARSYIFSDRRATANGATHAQGDGRHQHAVAAHMHVGFYHRAVLVSAIVVGGDAACAVVHPLPHGGIA